MKTNILKLEIILAYIYMIDLVELMEKHGIHGYTGMEITSSKGVRHGEQRAESFMPANKNIYLFSILSSNLLDDFKPALSKFLNTRGGAMIITEVLETTNVDVHGEEDQK
ncbi:MAG: hypothetical protein GC180_05735 [Bacteroidetes bacterium]|nr:hypothetical protein [Bacteroidota bacterium]